MVSNKNLVITNMDIRVNYKEAFEWLFVNNQLVKSTDYLSCENSGNLFPVENLYLPVGCIDDEVILAKVFRYNHVVSEEKIIFDMQGINYRPANIFEATASAIKRPELYRKTNLVVLASGWWDACLNQNIKPYFSAYYKSCQTSNTWIGRDYRSNCYFIGVPGVVTYGADLKNNIFIISDN